MLHIGKIAWQRRKFEKFPHSNFPVEASWFPEIAGLAVLISEMENYTLHINCLKPNRLWSARFSREIAQVSVLFFSPQNVLSIYPRLPSKYFNFCTWNLAWNNFSIVLSYLFLQSWWVWPAGMLSIYLHDFYILLSNYVFYKTVLKSIDVNKTSLLSSFLTESPLSACVVCFARWWILYCNKILQPLWPVERYGYQWLR